MMRTSMILRHNFACHARDARGVFAHSISIIAAFSVIHDHALCPCAMPMLVMNWLSGRGEGRSNPCWVFGYQRGVEDSWAFLAKTHPSKYQTKPSQRNWWEETTLNHLKIKRPS